MKKVVLVNAGWIWNVPPLFSVAQALCDQGYECEILGYQGGDLPAEEFRGRVKITRLPLKGRAIPISALRKAVSLAEFMARVALRLRRERPYAVILFNDPIFPLMPWLSRIPKRVGWLLEFPEFERDSCLTSAVNRFSARFWSRGTMFVAPTHPRLALHCAHTPKVARLPLAVIENVPSSKLAEAEPSCDSAREAMAFIAECRKASRKIAVYSGGVAIRHGVGLLLDAVTNTSGWALLILGPTGDKDLARKIEKLDAAAAVVCWLDPVPYAQLHGILKLCDAGFAYYEPDTLNHRFCAPGKLYDYLMNGVPIIAQDTSNLYGEVMAARAGAFFATASADSVSKCLRAQIFENEEALRAAKRRARDVFMEKLALEHRIDPLLAHLAE